MVVMRQLLVQPLRRALLLRGAAAVTFAALAAAPEADASTFSIDRTRIYLTRQHTSETVTLQNQSDEPLRIEVSAFRWTQVAGESMLLEATDDLIFFPPVATIEPGQSRQIRVAFTGSGAAREAAYRIVIEELPSGEVSGGNTIRVLTRLNVPVFVQPDRATRTPSLGALNREGSTLIVPVLNEGSSHVMVDSITVTGLDVSDSELFAEQTNGWYVLAGSSNVFSLDLPPACDSAASFRVTVRAAEHTLSTVLPRAEGPCRP
jgi:fimbrial chaperone protein